MSFVGLEGRALRHFALIERAAYLLGCDDSYTKLRQLAR
jgi:hypothetical protein